MARVVWTEPALFDLEAIAEYIDLDDARAASRYVQRVFTDVDRLEQFPQSGRRVPELPEMHYREIIVRPCRIIYRVQGEDVLILHVLRSERLLRSFRLERDQDN